jgi:hypothetical protein
VRFAHALEVCGRPDRGGQLERAGLPLTQVGESCPDLPFATNRYPTGSLLSGAPEPAPFDGGLSSQERVAWALRTPDVPYSVDVDLLTDAEVAESCLTAEQGVLPPDAPRGAARARPLAVDAAGLGVPRDGPQQLRHLAPGPGRQVFPQAAAAAGGPYNGS